MFRAHETNTAPNAASLVGRMTLARNVDGQRRYLDLQHLVFCNATGSASPPGTNGRGTMAVTEGGSVHRELHLLRRGREYICLMRADGTLSLGRAEAQTVGPYSNSMLSGSFVFGATGDSGLNFAAIHTVGVFNADGSGAIIGGAFDSVQDGNVQSNVAITWRDLQCCVERTGNGWARQ